MSKKIVYLSITGEEPPKEIRSIKQRLRRNGFSVVCPDEWAPMNTVFDPEGSLWIREKIIEQVQYMYLTDEWDQYEKTILEATKAQEWGCTLLFSPDSGYTLSDEEKREIGRLWRRRDFHALHKELWMWMAEMASSRRFLRKSYWPGWAEIDSDEVAECLYDFSFACAAGRRISGEHEWKCEKCPIKDTCCPTISAKGVDLLDNSPFVQFNNCVAEGNTSEASKLALAIANAEWAADEE